MNIYCKIGVMLISIVCIVIRTVQVQKTDRKVSDELVKRRETLKQRLGQLKEANLIYYKFLKNLEEYIKNTDSESEAHYSSEYYKPRFYWGQTEDQEQEHMKENSDFKKYVLSHVEIILEQEFNTNPTYEDVDEKTSVDITRTEDVDELQRAVNELEKALGSHKSSMNSLMLDLKHNLAVSKTGQEIHTPCSFGRYEVGDTYQYTFTDHDHISWLQETMDEIKYIKLKIKELTNSTEEEETDESF